MKRVNSLLDQKDRELVQRFKINKEIQIKILKLQANVNIKIAQKVLLIFPSNCNVSTNEFKSKNHVNYRKTEKSEIFFKCHLCPYSSALNHRLKHHMWTHSGYKHFKCEKCSYGTNRKISLEYHTNSKHNKNPETRKRNYPCQLCSKRFLSNSALSVHLAVHTKNKPFLCQFCSTSFAAKVNKNCHEITCSQNPKGSDPVWLESQKRFQCKLCGRKVITKYELTIHIRQHTQERPYKCGKCHYAGISSGDLKNHVDRRHNPKQNKNFACRLCQKLFLMKGDLYQHINTHTKETLSVCMFCKKKFVRSGNRNRHQIICKGNPKQSDEEWVREQKKFKCELCEYASVDRTRLKKHLKIHARANK